MTTTPFVVIAHRMARFGASTGPLQSGGQVVIFESREAAQIQADAWNRLNEREAGFDTPDLRIVPSSVHYTVEPWSDDGRPTVAWSEVS